MIAEALGAGRPVVVDNTNPTPADRAPLLMIARELGLPTSSYAFVSTVADSLARNAAREGRARVPDAGIFTVAKKLVPPSADEGFDRRFEVRLTREGFVVNQCG
jgi:predicted kinase